MWEKGVLGHNTPETLIHTIWFNNTKLFGLRGNHGNRQMRWGDVKLKTDTNGNEEQYLEWNERLTKTRAGQGSHHRPFAPKIFPNKQHPDRYPLIMYTLCASKRSVECLRDESPFYLSLCQMLFE